MDQKFWELNVELNAMVNAMWQSELRRGELMNEFREIINELVRRRGTALLDSEDMAEINTLCTVARLDIVFRKDGTTWYSMEV
ncbi:hypothetical protein Aduo_019637 [Ancylostoma duodenale]